MTAGEFLNFFNPRELVRICQLNKASYHLIQTKVNFKVLFEAQGFKLTPNELESVEISASMALQVAAKRMILNSIIKSKRMIGAEKMDMVQGSVVIPDMK
jgi:hypothetical protein